MTIQSTDPKTRRDKTRQNENKNKEKHREQRKEKKRKEKKRKEKKKKRMASYALLPFVNNVNGWGPSTYPAKFIGLPYSDYNKAGRIGALADFSAQTRQYRERADKRHGRVKPKDAESDGSRGQHKAKEAIAPWKATWRPAKPKDGDSTGIARSA